MKKDYRMDSHPQKRLILWVMILFGLTLLFLPLQTAAFAEGQSQDSSLTQTKVSDASTMNSYVDALTDSMESTRYSGRVWADKTVLNGYADPVKIDGFDIDNNSDFIEVFSALGSTQSVSQLGSAPIDLVLAIDVSPSMGKPLTVGGSEFRISKTIEAVNGIMDYLMESSPENRVGLVLFSTEAQTLLPLDHYTKASGEDSYLSYEILDTFYGDEKYFSVSAKTDKNPSGVSITNQASFEDPSKIGSKTNISAGLREGYNTFLKDKDNDKVRVNAPKFILLTDGLPNQACVKSEDLDTAESLWNQITEVSETIGFEDITGEATKPALEAIEKNNFGKVFDTLMTGSYFKSAVEKLYGKTPETVAIGVNMDSGSDFLEDPGYFIDSVFYADKNFNESAETSSNEALKSAYEKWKEWSEKSSTVDLEICSVETKDEPPATEILKTKVHYSQLSSNDSNSVTKDDIKRNICFTNSYYGIDAANQTKVLGDLVKGFTGNAFHPIDSEAANASGDTGALTYTDPIGDYMAVSDVKNLILYGNLYSVQRGVTYDDPQSDATVTHFNAIDPNGTASDIVNPGYTDGTSFKLTDIDIRLLEYSNGSQTLQVVVPEAALPVLAHKVTLGTGNDENGSQVIDSVESNFGSAASKPIRIVYATNLKTEVLDEAGHIDLSKIDEDYKANHIKDGSIYFYPNRYSAGDYPLEGFEKVGDTTVSFVPSQENRFYFTQANQVVYAESNLGEGELASNGGVGATLSSPLDDIGKIEDSRSYFVSEKLYRPSHLTYGPPGTEIEKNGKGEAFDFAAAFKGEKLLNNLSYFSTTLSEQTDAPGPDAYVATRIGGHHNGDLSQYVVTKEGNPTQTAPLSYAPIMPNSTTTRNVSIALGNNGMLALSLKPSQLTIQKEQSLNGEALTKDELLPLAGDTITYTLTVENTGEVEATNATVTDKIPEGLTLVPDSITASGTESNGIVTWTIPKLTQGEKKQLSFSVTVPAVDGYTLWENTATLTPQEEDPVQSNTVKASENAPELAIEKTQALNGADPTKDEIFAAAGDTITYYLTVTNTGDTTATNITVTDEVPQGLKLAPNTISPPGEERDGLITWVVLEIAPGESEQLSFSVNTPAVDEPTYWENTATLNPQSKEPVKSNTVKASEDLPKLSIQKEQALNDSQFTMESVTGNGEDTLSYRITVKNLGDVALSNLTVSDQIPLGLSLLEDSLSEDANVKDGVITWLIQSLNAGESVTLSYSTTMPTVSEPTTWENSAVLKPENGDPMVSNTVVAEEGVAHLKIEKLQSLNGSQNTKDPLEGGGLDTLTYTINVSNTGDSIAKNTTVTDQVPAGLTLKSDTVTGNAAVEGDLITWLIESLEPGESESFTFEVILPVVDEITTWENTAYLQPQNQEPKPSNTVVVAENLPDLSIEKLQSLNDGEPTKEEIKGEEGDTLTYILNLSNFGEAPALNVTVTDQIPNGLSLKEGSVNENGTVQNQTITWTFEKLEPGETRTLMFSVILPAVTEHSEWENTAYLNFENGSRLPSNTVEVSEGVASLSIEKSQSVGVGAPTKQELTVSPGDTITYYITLANNGDTEARDISVSDPVPEGLTIIPESISDFGFLEEDTITWRLGNLPEGQKYTFSFKAQVPSLQNRSSWRNVATAIVPEKPPIQSNPVDAVGDPAHLRVEKLQRVGDGEATKDLLRVRPGDQITYIIQVTNTSNVLAKNVVINDKVPIGLILMENSLSNKASLSNDVITWRVGDLGAHESVELRFTALVPQKLTHSFWENTAHASCENAPDSPSNTVRALDSEPEITIEKTQAKDGQEPITGTLTVTQDDVVTYYLKVSNVGSGESRNLKVTDKIPDGLELVESSINEGGVVQSNNEVCWTIQSLEANKSVTLSFSVKVPVTSTESRWSNTAYVTPENSEKIPSNTVTITENMANLVLEKTQSVGQADPTDQSLDVSPDDTVVYYLTLKNMGEAKAYNVTVTDPIPEGLAYIEGSASDSGTYSNKAVSWLVKEIGPGESVKFNFSVKVPLTETKAIYRNAAYAQTRNDERVDSNTVVVQTGSPDVDIEKTQSVNGSKASALAQKVEPGDEVTYYLTLTNAGDTDAVNVEVTDRVPEGLSLVPGSITKNGEALDGTVTWLLESLSPNASETFAFSVTVPSSSDGTWRNIASVSYENSLTPGPKPSNEVVISEGGPIVNLEKLQAVNDSKPSKDKKNVAQGDKVTYHFVLSNTGDAPATNVNVNDEVPEELELLSSSVSDNGQVSGRTVSWTVDKLEPNESRNLSFSVNVPSTDSRKSWSNIASFLHDALDEPASSNTVVIEKLATDLVIEKTQSVGEASPTTEPLIVEPGDIVTYYINVTNKGSATVENIKLSDVIPQGLSLKNAGITGDGEVNANTITWNLPSLEPGESKVVSFEAQIPEGDQSGLWRNTAKLSYPSDDGEETLNSNTVEASEDPLGEGMEVEIPKGSNQTDPPTTETTNPPTGSATSIPSTPTYTASTPGSVPNTSGTSSNNTTSNNTTSNNSTSSDTKTNNTTTTSTSENPKTGIVGTINIWLPLLLAGVGGFLFMRIRRKS